MAMTLVELFNKGGYDKYPTDKGTDHSYLTVYDELFKPYKNKKINLLEIGYYKGGSIKLWEDYFPKAKIMAVDINPQDFEESNVVLGDRVTFIQHNVRYLSDIDFSDFPIDIAIEDGSHQIRSQARFIRTVYPFMRDGGIIVIEDVNCYKNWRHFYALNDIDISYEVIDLREVSGRPDDCLIIVRK